MECGWHNVDRWQDFLRHLRAPWPLSASRPLQDFSHSCKTNEGGGEKEEKEFKQRQFRSDWSNASARFNKEQIENYNFQIKCILENYHDDFYRKREIESLQRNLISNPNYMKYSKNEFHQKTERLAVRQNQEKRSDNDYDPPSPF